MAFTSALPTSRAGKPIAVNDQVSLVGTVDNVTGVGPSASVTFRTASGVVVTVPAGDMYNAMTL